MNDIVFTLEFDDDNAGDRANEMLEKGWKLLHVGSKVVEISSNEQLYYNTTYVVGANKEQHAIYKKKIEEEEKNDPLKDLI